MTDRNKTIAELTAANNAVATDLLVIEDVSESETKSITLTLLVTELASEIGEAILLVNSTPANSAITVTEGRVFFDSSYLYVATANNTLKRVALSAF